MSNVKTPVEHFEVKDLEDGSKIEVLVEHCTEVGNAGKPGLQVWYMGNVVCFEPLMAERLAYQARKAGKTEHYLEDRSWAVHDDQFVKLFLVCGDKPEVRVEVKTRSKSKAIVKTYPLPFALDEE
ncbi:MAG: hypothetical protein H6835_03120 [Planctomycetes bacterium]|nr:hypothetical protein [Planctomycetota bacterium]